MPYNYYLTEKGGNIMSLNLLIADDEYFIRKRLYKIIPWEDLGLHFAGEAENGEQVLEILQQSRIDILLLDIKMPKLNGLDTAQYVKEHYPHIQIIILSGYNDFEYARSAIRCGVKDYLLKPIQDASLIQALSDCISCIKEEAQTRHLLRLYEHYQLCTQLAGVRDGITEYDAFCVQYPEFSQLHYSLYCSLYTDLDPVSAADRLADQFRNSGFSCEYSQESESICILQIFAKKKEDFLSVGSIFTDFIAQEDGYVFIYLDEIFDIRRPWSSYYKRSLHLLSERYFSQNSNLFMRYSHRTAAEFQNEILQFRKNFISVLNTHDAALLREFIDELFRSLSEKKNCDYLVLVIVEFFMIYHIYFQIPENLSQAVPEFAAQILAAEYSLENLKNEVLFYGLQCINKIDTIPSDVALYQKIRAYVEENYTTSTLSVAQIASHFNMSASYLGSIFKKISHISILQYISDLRINQAKKLLEEGTLKISEVAEMSGYSDVYYFSKKFKKACGCTPKSYASSCNTI